VAASIATAQAVERSERVSFGDSRSDPPSLLFLTRTLRL
jgi:hypothetical protein